MAYKIKKYKRYMLVDGHALIHRAFHAIAHLSTKSGEPTNAVYGFTVILLKAIKDLNPSHVAVSFDLSAPTFRHAQYKEYKATRVKVADELSVQFPRCREIVRSLGIPVFEMENYEADDVLGTLASEIKKENIQAGEHNFEVLIVTGDLDTLQLVDEHVKVYTMRKGLTDTVTYDIDAVRERYGIGPAEFVDFKAIKGDTSDNIPGIRGIGEKGALDLIKQYGSLQNIYAHLGELKERVRHLFEEQKEQAQMSYELSKIVCDVPIQFSLPEYVFSRADYQRTIRLFQDLEFKSLIPKLPKVRDIESAESEVILGKKHGITAAPEKKDNTTATAPPVRHNDNYYLVDTPEKLELLSADLQKQKEFAFDTETSGLGALDFDLVGMAFSYQEGSAYYVPANLLLKTTFDGLRKVFADEAIGKIAHNIKYDYLVLKKFGITVKNLYFDTMIASYLLSPGSRAHDLDTAAFNEFGYQMQPIEELIGAGKNQKSLRDIDVHQVCFYCSEDVDYTFRLKNLLYPRLVKEGLDKIFFTIEMPLTRVLAEMEENGIALDINKFKELQELVERQLSVLEQQIYALAGEEFNINSPAQLKVIIFDKLKIQLANDAKFIKKTKTGFSTAASELEKMRGMHGIIDKVLEYRELAKLQSTYIKALPELVSKTDHRLHTSWNQTVAATGRLSSSNPNLQNIPVRESGIAAEIRKGFVAAPGKKLLSIDYSQIELRVVAHLSGDPTMVETFRKGHDIHTATAMQIYGIDDPGKVNKDMRRDAKTINFGVLYGLSSFGLSERIEMSRAEASDFIKKYFQAFPKVDAYLRSIVTQTQLSGFADNELGRKRYFPEINSQQFMVRSAAERAAINMPIQSLAADIVKIAMNNIAKEMDIQSEQLKLLLQVHDALIFEVDGALLDSYTVRLKKIMENAYSLKVPLIAEASVGDNWGELH